MSILLSRLFLAPLVRQLEHGFLEMDTCTYELTRLIMRLYHLAFGDYAVRPLWQVGRRVHSSGTPSTGFISSLPFENLCLVR